MLYVDLIIYIYIHQVIVSDDMHDPAFAVIKQMLKGRKMPASKFTFHCKPIILGARM